MESIELVNISVVLLPDIRKHCEPNHKVRSKSENNNDRKSLLGFECITACKNSNVNYICFSDMHNNNVKLYGLDHKFARLWL